jgi:uncharacterized protein YecE (DUF72 family)
LILRSRLLCYSQEVPALSPFVRFGTSTWTYEGWQGLVYHKTYARNRFKQECLAEYAGYLYRGEPLFRTVGFDQTFYSSPTDAQLAFFAQQLPTGFEVCSKVWEEITVPMFASHPRYGKKMGQANPGFLDADRFLEQVLLPYSEAFRGHTGPFLFEFQRTGLDRKTFLPQLDRFLSRLPKAFSYAIEVRDVGLLIADYHGLLKTHGVSHVYNHWTYMPALRQQHARLEELFTAPFVVIRLLTPLGMKYEDAVRTTRPYNRLVRPLPEMRADVMRLIRQGTAEQREVFVLVNNRAEGCAPLTTQALVDDLTGTATTPQGALEIGGSFVEPA